MKKLSLFALGLALLLCGCAHYNMMLVNGSKVRVSGKPKLKDGYYLYKSGSGKIERIPASRVVEIDAE